MGNSNLQLYSLPEIWAEQNSVEERKCRVCGCTDFDCSGCVERTGRPCHWIEWDLCSACETKDDDRFMLTEKGEEYMKSILEK